jgi:hypothetical protein
VVTFFLHSEHKKISEKNFDPYTPFLKSGNTLTFAPVPGKAPQHFAGISWNNCTPDVKKISSDLRAPNWTLKTLFELYGKIDQS